MSDAELLTRAAEHAEYTARCALSRWSVASNPLTDSLIKDAAALRRLADKLAALRPEVERLGTQVDDGRVERVARAIYGTLPQQYVGKVHVDRGHFSDPEMLPITWDDEPEPRREFFRKLALAAMKAMEPPP